jgi:transcriptional regulator with PAS, ATPase and Fis domain
MLTIFIYTIEKKEKLQFLNYQQIQRMNIELKNILMKFPEGIVLIDEDGEVCLKNQEFHRIFQK